MRILFLALTGVVLFSAVFWDSTRPTIPTVSADTVSIRQVRANSPDALIVERPDGAEEGAKSSVLVLTDNDVLRRVPVHYGRASSSSIEVVSGLSAGDRIIVSDMRAWDAFERIQLSGATSSSKRMADGKQWTTRNLDVDIVPSYCYEDAALNCRQFGRLYTWESAQQGCRSLGDGWRLPTNDEWAQMAKPYGGLMEDSHESSKATFRALMVGGSSGFNALLGGNREPNGEYARLDAHGVYWTASETDRTTAWAYNFGRGGQALSRHSGFLKQRAASVRCVRD